jgi:hypothetical protein
MISAEHKDDRCVLAAGATLTNDSPWIAAPLQDFLAADAARKRLD